MKVAKVVLAIVLGIIAISLAWKTLTLIIGMIMTLISNIVLLAIGVAVIGGLGWAILRLIGKKPLSGNKYESLP